MRPSALLKKALFGSIPAMPVEIWFQDEARVGQKGGGASGQADLVQPVRARSG
jgi:hypothetical protein